MSVLASKRHLSKVEFLKNLTALQEQILHWCIKQPPKYKSFGIEELYNYAQEAKKYACLGNSIYVKSVNSDNDVELLNVRIQHFEDSKRQLTLLDYHIPTLYEVYNLSLSRIEQWCELISNARKQIDGVIKSDKNRIRAYINQSQ